MDSSTNIWNKCNHCDVLIYSKDEKVHNEFCSTSVQEKNFLLPHAFIRKGVLHTFVKKVTADVKNVLPNFKKNLLLMHPSTMKLLNFVRGCWLLLKNEKGYLILMCWSSTKIEPNQFVMPSFSTLCHYTKNSFEISRYCGEIDLADKVVLNFEEYHSFMDSKHFKGSIRNILGNFPLIQGLTINALYLGNTCCFSIKQIEKSNLYQNGETVDKCIDNLCSDLLCLNVNSVESNELTNNSVPEKSCAPVASINKSSSKKKSRNKLKKLSTSKFFTIYQNTQIFSHCLKKDFHCSKYVSFDDFGGLDKQIEAIKVCFNNFLAKDSNHYRGILLIGASGTGKSMMLKAIQSEYELPIFNLKKHFYARNGNSCKNEFKEIFDHATQSAPSIILIDEIDLLCSNQRTSYTSQKQSQKAVQLSLLIHNVLKSKKVMVIGTAQNINNVDMCLRKSGVLEKEITFPILSAAGRKQVLSKMLNNCKSELSPQQISDLVDMTHGFTGGDIKQFFEKARLHSLLKDDQKVSDEPLLTWMHLKKSLKDVNPSSMAEFKIEVPNVNWSDIGGMHSVKNTIIEMVDWPLKHAEQFKKFHITPSRGVLLYGPPGCSKTMIAKALVSESHLNFISIKGPQLFNKYVGESEKCVSELFKKARSATPCVIFFDEIDSLATVRGSTSGNSNVADRVLTQILIEIDGIDVLKGVSIIAATNRPDMIDPSLLRPGRFDHMIYVPLPDASTRREILEVKLQKMPIACDVDLGYLVDATENYTGAEITDLCREAAMSVIKDNVMSLTSVVTMNHFLLALQSVLPRTTKETIEFYEKYVNKFVIN